jgi:hypothetical protein
MQEAQVAKRPAQLPRERLVDDFSLDFTIDHKGLVFVPQSWRNEHLVKMPLPAASYGGKEFWIHRGAERVFQAWFNLWVQHGVAGDVVTFDGSFVPRLMRSAGNLEPTDDPTRDWGRKYLSRHSRGIAIDLNAKGNEQGTDGDGSLMRVIDLAAQVRVPVVSPKGVHWEAGIVCGAHWAGKLRDPMHAEVGAWM